MTTTITLPRPITVLGQERTTLTIRALKLKDLADLNLRLSEQGLTLVAGDLMAAIARAANVPAAALGELTIAEGIEVAAACVPFLGLPLMAGSGAPASSSSPAG